ncbi:MAG: hypothetical protein M1817_004178 [Caeruleum heppii]|nr:MAG: hypothetical protein M1817_004178 [Caeruleum heppii]
MTKHAALLRISHRPSSSLSLLSPPTPFCALLHRTLLSPYTPLCSSHFRYETTSALRINHNTRVNGPVTTLPAPLVLLDRAPDEAFIKYAYQRGKGYLTFYKTGVKNVWANFQRSRTLRALIASRADGSLPHALSQNLLSRADYQLLHRSAHDVRRVPLFALILLVFAEWTPFIVPFVPSVVPRTCWIPSQVLTDREKLEGRRRESFRNLVVPPPTPSNTDHETAVSDLNRDHLLHISNSLNLHSVWWPTSLAPESLPATALLQSRVRKHVGYLDMDDELIRRDGGPGEMEVEELRMALEERGVDVVGRNDSRLRALMRGWLTAKEKEGWSTLGLLVTR